MTPDDREPPPLARKPFWRGLSIGGLMAIVAALSLLFAAFAYQVRMQRGVRDAARRTACVCNLKQIALAIWMYEQKNGSFPTGTLPNLNLSPERRLGWMYPLISYMDLPLLSSADRPDLAWDDPALRALASPVPGALRCPSNLPTAPAPSAAYVGIAGLGIDAPGLPKGDPRAGLFGDNRMVAPGDVTDGLAQTMMIAESTVPTGGPWFAGGRHTVRGLDPNRQPYIGQGRQFGGNHGAGANVLMADGSVRFVKETVDPKVFEAISTIAGGEKVSAP